MDGLRQDFLVGERPVGSGDLIVDSLLEGAQATATSCGVKLTLQGSRRELAYSRLRVTDATGRELPARMEVASEWAANRQVLECGSRLPLWHRGTPDESARGLAQSKALSRLAVRVDDTDAI
jgi:hypothetical protein